MKLKEYKKRNNKGFTLIELLVVIAILAIISTIVIYSSVNIIGSAKEKSYLASINNIEKVAESYTLENTKEVYWNNVENSMNQYYCASVKDLIETGYFDSNILKTKISESEVVTENDYIYVERDYNTKNIIKNSLIKNSNNKYTNCILYQNNASISFSIDPIGWHKEKEVTITYKLIRFEGEYSDYTYSSNDGIKSIDDGKFENKIVNTKVNVLDNGVIYSEIKDKNGNVIANKTLNVGKIDKVNPNLILTVTDGDKYKQSNSFIASLIDKDSGLKSGKYDIYFKWSLDELSCEDIKGYNEYVSLSSLKSGINSLDTAAMKITDENGLGSIYACLENAKDVAGNEINNILVSTKMYLDNEKPTIKLGNYNGSNEVSKKVSIPLVFNDEYSGVDSDSFTVDDLIVKIGDTVVSSGISLEKIDDNNYNLIINNNTNNGLITINITKNKLFDNAGNGNEETNLNLDISFKNLYTISYYFKDNLIGTSECAYGSRCTLKEFDLSDNFIKYDSDNKWKFYGWTTSKTSTERVYKNKEPFLYKENDNINLYAIGYKNFYFYSGIAPSNSDGYVKQVQYLYPSNGDYLSSITIPNLKELISGFNFVGYLCGSNNADGTITYESSLQNTSTTPNTDAKQSCRGVYKRDITLVYNANGGSGTVSNSTAIQYYNTGYGNGKTNSGANVSKVTFTLATNNFTKNGYKFNNWAADSTSGKQYNVGSTYSVTPEVSSTSTTYNMYALWSINKVYFNFNTNGGTIVSSTTADDGTVYNWTTSNGIVYRSVNGGASSKDFWYKNSGATNFDLPNWDGSKYLKINRAGYIAQEGAEWLCYEGCTNSNKTFSDTAKYSLSDFCDTSNGDCTVKLKVNWTKRTYTIKYDANGGSGAPASQTKTHDTTLTLSSTKPTNGNYEFLGWSTSKTATSATYTAGGKYTSNSNATLYAVWFPYEKYKTTGEVNVWRADSNCTGTSSNSQYYSYWCGSCYVFQSRPANTEYYLVGRDTKYGGNTTIYLYVYVDLSDTSLFPLSDNCTSQVSLGKYSGDIEINVDGSSKTLPVVTKKDGKDLYLVRMITYCENTSCGNGAAINCRDGSCNNGWVTNWRP